MDLLQQQMGEMGILQHGRDGLPAAVDEKDVPPPAVEDVPPALVDGRDGPPRAVEDGPPAHKK